MTLYSENKERENRFMLSLKIAFPFVLVLILFGYMLFSKAEYSWEDAILFVILIACYVYYTIYLIYFAFKNSFLDPVTKVFTRRNFIKILEKNINKNIEKNVVLLNISNIQDINLRYGYKNGDILLKNFILKFSNFFEKNGYKNLPIGRYSGGSFLFLIDCKSSKLEHILKTFQRVVSKDGVDNIEVKLEFTTILTTYDRNWQNIINALFSKISVDYDDNELKVIKPDVLDELVCYAIEKSEFELKYQTIKPIKDDKECLNLSITLKSFEVGQISKNRVLEIAAKNNYEIKYDLQVIKFIAENFEFDKFNSRVFIEISPVSLRNGEFNNEIYRLITNGIIDPSKIVFEIYEKGCYDEILRFSEIIKNLKEFGFKIALNQFSADNASFEYFKYLDIDYVIYDIQMNKSLKNKKIRTIFDGLNLIAKKLGIKTIVRFVDKTALYEELVHSEVDYIQGFYIDKPKNIENLKVQNAIR
ncbi:bifunctional diguanylate cyclase/phosphodiesterase [Campylobacter geochelonis]|uniref:Putative diguanylate cyclase/phosphodiesterase n=1 Tax=Campylobacter geochelonis TaxID=1780362 RepID=A0A128ECG0_9BACT|nr:GGDEF domain-containing protein [Campylobacter geochelonis]QKF70349.1 diguanylate phosphodiesterase [Campylobacter geochelonis]CZE46167.1 putative diguanylate cyclase/phosphodiesterase [Campylobacter geochelonis]CZE46461.1 putative diguanylate cyclase/phosphodiesterase [Campylobacter geochelonis]CZE50766.1 putative diguanylate cyclase/phosphodiesterase [Campylobacter geochelonis]